MNPNSSSDYNISLKQFHHSFVANGITFSTGFITIFLYTLSFGLTSIWLPLGFVIGTLFYGYVVLPYHAKIIPKYDSLVEFIAPHQAYIRKSILSLIIGNYLLYGILEIQGLRYFARSSNMSSLHSEIFVALSLGLMLFYLYKWKLQGVFLSDTWQVRIIYIGCTLLWILGLQHFIINPTPIQFLEIFSQPLFIFQMILGFLCGQILYAENWLRLSAYLKQAHLLSCEIRALQRPFILSALQSFAVFSTAILLGLLARNYPENIYHSDPMLAFVFTLQDLSPPQPLVSGLFWGGMLIMVTSAVLSTLDTFLITCSHLLNQEFKRWQKLFIVFCCLCYGLSLLNYDFTSIYILSSFMLNLFIAPIVWRFLYKKPYPLPRWYVLFAGSLFCTLSCFMALTPEWLGICLLGLSLLTLSPYPTRSLNNPQNRKSA